MPYPRIRFSAFVLLPLACGGLALDEGASEAPQPEARSLAAQVSAAEPELAGTWLGDDDGTRGEVLTLRADGSGDLDGAQLTWSLAGKGRVRYVLGGESTTAGYRIEGDHLHIEVAGERLRYRRRPKVQGYQVPPPLSSVDRSVGARHRHAQGEYSFELPLGWTIGAQSDEGLWIQPGIAEGEALDALILVHHGELEAVDRDTAPAVLIERYDEAFRADLRSSGIDLAAPAGKPQPVLVGDVPGAIQEWQGKTADGRELRVWLGGVVRRDAYLTVSAAILAGREERFLPGVKRVFATLAPEEPVRNPALERVLAGRSFRHSESFGRSGSSYSWYSFGADGSVKKELSMGGLVGLGDSISGTSEEWGRYEVIGESLYLYFRDGQSTGTVALEGEQLVGLRMHGVLYRVR